jgi:acyl-coenzyme A thioesterase PaaI-like protein
MILKMTSPARTLRNLWRRLSPLPGGKWLFGRALGRMVPYTGTVRPHFLELAPGYAKVEMADRRIVRNHLNSIHAVALVNLAEVAGGLAMLLALPDDVRAIVTGLSIEYVKKARGVLTAECRFAVPDVTSETDLEPMTVIRDRAEDVVARMTVRWKVEKAGSRQ